MTDLVPIRRALLSVSDKAGLEPLAAALVARGVELVSTGGTATALRALGHAVKDVAELTGSPGTVRLNSTTGVPVLAHSRARLEDSVAEAITIPSTWYCSIRCTTMSCRPRSVMNNSTWNPRFCKARESISSTCG
jgi:hypothetical protein